MKALKIESFGAPSEGLKYVDVEDTPLGAKEARVRIEAAGINPSDVGKHQRRKDSLGIGAALEGGALGPHIAERYSLADVCGAMSGLLLRLPARLCS